VARHDPLHAPLLYWGRRPSRHECATSDEQPGPEPEQLMEILRTHQGWFNRMNPILFRSKVIATLCHSSTRSARNLLLKVKSVQKIHDLEEGRGVTIG
jgi:hypothetical protein